MSTADACWVGLDVVAGRVVAGDFCAVDEGPEEQPPISRQTAVRATLIVTLRIAAFPPNVQDPNLIRKQTWIPMLVDPWPKSARLPRVTRSR